MLFKIAYPKNEEKRSGNVNISLEEMRRPAFCYKFIQFETARALGSEWKTKFIYVDFKIGISNKNHVSPKM